MSGSTVGFEAHGAVGVVTMNRPEGLNAFDPALRHDLLETLQRVAADPALHIVVLTGAGKVFSAGADLKTTTTSPDNTITDQIIKEYQPILAILASMPKITIAAVNGPAVGIGASLGLSADLMIMADSTYLSLAFAAIALVPDGGATYHLYNAMGYRRALEAVLEGRKLTAAECLRYGLCNRIAPLDELMGATLIWAQTLAAGAPLAQRHAKELMRAAGRLSVDEMIRDEAVRQHIAMSSADHREGLAAFKEKRAPKFTGA